MWVSKKKWTLLEKRVADLEGQVQGQQLKNELLWEFCRSVANTEKLGLISYQQLHSPCPESADKIRILIHESFKFGKHSRN